MHLLDSMGRKIESQDPIGDTGKLIDEGYIVAVKGIGGYHLASLATSSEALNKLRERKRRGGSCSFQAYRRPEIGGFRSGRPSMLASCLTVTLKKGELFRLL